MYYSFNLIPDVLYRKHLKVEEEQITGFVQISKSASSVWKTLKICLKLLLYIVCEIINTYFDHNVHDMVNLLVETDMFWISWLEWALILARIYVDSQTSGYCETSWPEMSENLSTCVYVMSQTSFHLALSYCRNRLQTRTITAYINTFPEWCS